MKKLTNRNYWDDIWKNIVLPATINISEPNRRIFHDKFKQFLLKKNKFEFIEIGGAPGSWSSYFHNEFGYKVYCLDYSKTGIEITKRNFKLLHIQGNIVNKDFLTCNIRKKFDVVASFGFIEHFNDTHRIISKHIGLLKKNGTLIISVPNVKKYSLINILQKIFDKDVYNQHVHHITPEYLDIIFKDKEFFISYNDYLGFMNLSMIKTGKNKFIKKILKALDIILLKFMDFFGIQNKNSFLSPYILFIGQKK